MTTTQEVPTAPAESDYTNVESLFAELAEAAGGAAIERRRARIITICLPLAEHIAYRFVGRGEPSDDLIQVARLGLVKAVDRYDPDKGRFLAFAVPTIIGEVRRHFRDNTWGMRVPRKVKNIHLRVRAAIDPMSQRLGRAPTPTELAAELELDFDDVAQALEAAYAYRPLSLDAAFPGADGQRTALSSHGSDDSRYGMVEDVMTVAELVDELSDQERDIVRMRFCDCMTQNQIAGQLGVSQVHVSRLLAKTLNRLRRSFWADMPRPPLHVVKKGEFPSPSR